MHNRELSKRLLMQVAEALNTISERFEPVASVEYFRESKEGRIRLDAICLPLSAVGENLKRVNHLTGGCLLNRHPSVDWRAAMATRDRIVHGYFDVDAEVVFDICKHFLPGLADVIPALIQDLESEEFPPSS